VNRAAVAYLSILFAIFISACPAVAHEIRPALLDIRHIPGSCLIIWRQPTIGEFAVPLKPRLSGGWLAQPAQENMLAATHHVGTWKRQPCSLADLERQQLSIDGLNNTITDVLVRVDYGDGHRRSEILHPRDPPLNLARGDRIGHGVLAYFRLGIAHILEGVDHLCFVLALILLVGFRARLAMAVTGFTLAHSLTLGATAFGLIAPWSALIEALVALSIAFVAAEVLRARDGQSSLTIRWPVIAAATFGLLHGFAFASALAEVGLPRDETLLALLLFNLGVEAGQLLFIALIFVIARAMRPLADHLPAAAIRVPPYAIGALAAFWFVDRAVSLLA